jgi:SpoVK/Ycf46/Vps4 family AAA+-type ATPase
MLWRGLVGLAHAIDEADADALVQATDGYSGSDMASLCREAGAML